MQTYNEETSKAFVKTFTIDPYQSGSLSGLRFAVKDLMDVAGYVTGCGNPTWAATHPQAVTHAICIDQLLASGASCVGKTMTDELAFSLIGENHFYGTPINPKAPSRVPGGSSCGSASAVACNLVDFALGTDTGGSVRVPASNCGIWGYRPTHGRISVAGVNPLAPTFDTVSAFASNASILKKVASVLIGATNENIGTLKQIVFLDDIFDICDPEIPEALSSTRKCLTKNFPNSINTLTNIVGQPITYEWLFETYAHIQCTEIWSCLGAWIEEENPKFGPVTDKNFRHLAKEMNRTNIQSSLLKRAFFAGQIQKFLTPGTLFCFPTTPLLAPKLNTIGKKAQDRRLSAYFPRVLGVNAISGLSRCPQITIPCGDAAGIPMGISLMASTGQDESLMILAEQIEQLI